jgi:hypothetical protein
MSKTKPRVIDSVSRLPRQKAEQADVQQNQAAEPIPGPSAEIVDLKNLLALAGQGKGKRSRTIDLKDGRTLRVHYDGSGAIDSLHFSDGRTLRTTDGGETYRDDLHPDLKLKELKLDLSDGALCYRTMHGRRSAFVRETSGGARFATLKVKGEEKEFQVHPDKRRVVIGKEGSMTFSGDGHYLTLQPKQGGEIKFHLWGKHLDVQFPDGFKQSFYATENELNLLRQNPLGFYVKWLPTDSLGRHFEWGVVLHDMKH